MKRHVDTRGVRFRRGTDKPNVTPSSCWMRGSSQNCRRVATWTSRRRAGVRSSRALRRGKLSAGLSGEFRAAPQSRGAGFGSAGVGSPFRFPVYYVHHYPTYITHLRYGVSRIIKVSDRRGARTPFRLRRPFPRAIIRGDAAHAALLLSCVVSENRSESVG